MQNKRWKLYDLPDPDVVCLLKEKINASDALANILAIRKIDTFEKAKKFFLPNTDNLYDPFLFLGMDIAVKRIIDAIDNNEKFYVYGDYDVDGTCSVAILYLFLKELNADVHYYIPVRDREGYGISKLGINHIVESGAKLLISVDCGITAIEEVEYAKSYNLDVIITDHHNPKEQLPDALTVIDPLRPGCKYPFKYLSGAGIAFKLAQAICMELGMPEDMPFKYLDLAAIAAAADIVPIIDENRIIVNEGIQRINKSPRPGLTALIKSSGLKKNKEYLPDTPDKSLLSSSKIVFVLAPRINAVGRLGSADRAVKLLISSDIEEAETFANVLEEENTKRREEDKKTLISAEELLAATRTDDDVPIVLHQDNWHQGVIGIVASRLVEKYYRPTVMLTTVDGIAKGSARSIPNFNIYNALKECEDLLIHFGGHKAAAGLAIEIKNIDKFKNKFNNVVKETIKEDDLFPEIYIDTIIELNKITNKFYYQINRLQPYGPGNMRPVFLAENVRILYQPRVFKDKHLGICVKQENSEKFECIGWNIGEYAKKIRQGNNIDIIFTLDKQGSNIQLVLKDLKIKEKY